MSWNYRVVQYETQGETLFTIGEVYYDAEGKPNGWCVGSLDAWTTLDDLKDSHALMAGAFEKPIVLERDLSPEVSDGRKG